jgi:hypothetical protein
LDGQQPHSDHIVHCNICTSPTSALTIINSVATSSSSSMCSSSPTVVLVCFFSWQCVFSVCSGGGAVT